MLTRTGGGSRSSNCRRPSNLVDAGHLAALFRGKFLSGVKEALQAGKLALPEPLENPVSFQALLDRLYAKAWVVYSKPPFGSPQQVLSYLARYTHRVAISNYRLLRLEDDQVSFTYKDYSQGGRVREMTLPVEEFIRRFLLHVLPQGLVRIRYYGLLSNRHRRSNLARCRELLGIEAVSEGATDCEEGWQGRLIRLTGCDPTVCPVCGTGHLRRVEELAPSPGSPRPPP